MNKAWGTRGGWRPVCDWFCVKETDPTLLSLKKRKREREVRRKKSSQDKKVTHTSEKKKSRKKESERLKRTSFSMATARHVVIRIVDSFLVSLDPSQRP